MKTNCILISERDRIRQKLKTYNGRWIDLYTQAGVSRDWLRRFRDGVLDNVGVETLAKLQTALESEQEAA